MIKVAGIDIKFGAWLPWLVLHLCVSSLFISDLRFGISELIFLALYFVVSWFLGFIVCFIWRNDLIALLLAGFFLFGGPFMTYGYIEFRNAGLRADRNSAKEEVKRLCQKFGGDQIYRTVENVEGVYQMQARNPNYSLSDQYGMLDPWGFSQGDRESLSGGSFGYLFLEQNIGVGKQGPPYIRKHLEFSGRTYGDIYPDHSDPLRPVILRSQREVSTLRSRYGWKSEDITTKDMRDRWIGGGKTIIIDLATNEVLAVRTGYFTALGPLAPLHWARAGGEGGHSCPSGRGLDNFLNTVLKPVEALPTKEKLESVKE